MGRKVVVEYTLIHKTLLLQYALKIHFSKCIEGKTLKVKGGKFGFQLSVIPSVSFNKRAAQSFTHDSLCFGAIQSYASFINQNEDCEWSSFRKHWS